MRWSTRTNVPPFKERLQFSDESNDLTFQALEVVECPNRRNTLFVIERDNRCSAFARQQCSDARKQRARARQQFVDIIENRICGRSVRGQGALSVTNVFCKR